MSFRTPMRTIIGFLFCLLSQLALAESSVWKVSNGSDYLYLGGTIHLLAADDYPLPEEFDSAYKDAQTIILETDISAVNSPDFQAKLMAAMSYDDERTLASVLEPEVFSDLEQFMASRQIPSLGFFAIQPWGVMLLVTMMEYQRMGLLPGYGVDLHFNNRAMADNKTILGLETPEEQLSFLASMGEVDPNLMVKNTLQDLQRLPEFVDLMKSSWRSGDLEALSEYGMIEQMKADAPELYATLISRRNDAWMAQLPGLLDRDDVVFVLVGAMHLNGDDGMLNQLRQQGYEVTQVKTR
ncbi:MAG: TraB/GumN family protein [Pseudomonadota bacterium]